MGGVEQRGRVARLAATQWGLITTAQAVADGVPRILLSRMAASGELERIVYGVYATPSAAADYLVELRALWLWLDPSRMAEERLRERWSSGVFSHATAAMLHEVGDILDAEVEITFPGRYQGRSDRIRAHRGTLEPHDVTLAGGLPVTTAARTVADLVVAGHDRDHVATVMAEAVRVGLASVRDVARTLERHLGTAGADVLDELLVVGGLNR